MNSAAALDRLPDGLEFPDRLRRRIRFDPRRGQLLFHGFMAKADHDRLRGLSPEASYQSAVDQLFRDSSSIAVDIGIDQVLDVDRRGHNGRPGLARMARWALQWALMIASFVGSAALVWWWLSQLL